ncbi:LysR family transcriptional regulator [Phenylobacterium sp. CCH12-B4]|uniref:LysR family transcriptional regulator n=1 Tax=Phenylobacterium sp. CCH12-B4 TaxID=1768784 RepID=UPI001E39CA47|nr:LysR family transcriptional regulator [Phenylobacterium sp. CCH12-B4]
MNDLAAFMAVATHRSFRRAADELGAAPSTLSHAIRGLEAGLGVRLLNRTTRSVSPTEAGFQLLDALRPAIVQLDEALDAVAAFRGSVAGTVRVNAPRLAAAIIVRKVLPQMSVRFPDVTVDVVAEGKLIDIVSAGFDAGVRLADMIPRDMIAMRLSKNFRYMCVASPTYLDRAGVPATPDDLRRHRCVGHRLPSGKLYRWEFERGGAALTMDVPAPVVLDDEDLMVEAAVRGVGVAYVPALAAAAALASGQVREVLGDWTQAAEDVAVYYPRGRAVPPALRAFLDVVRDTASD